MNPEKPELYKFNRGEEQPEINIVLAITDARDGSLQADSGGNADTIMDVMKALVSSALDDIEAELPNLASYKVNVGLVVFKASGNLFLENDVATNGFTYLRNQLSTVAANATIHLVDYRTPFELTDNFFPSNTPAINILMMFTPFAPTGTLNEYENDVFEGTSGDMINPNNGYWNRMKGTSVNVFCFHVGEEYADYDYTGRIDNTPQDGLPHFYASAGNSLNVVSAIDLLKYSSAVSEWRFTSADRDITYNGEVYTAIPIGRNSPESGKEINRANLDISIARSVLFADDSLRYAAEALTSVTVFQMDSPTTANVFWRGRVASVKPNGNKVVLDCESIFTSLRRPGLRARFQRNCRHVLYGSGCGVNRELYKAEGTYESLDGTVLTAAFAAGQADGYYTGGIVKGPDGTLRFILKHVGSTLTLSRRFDPLETGGTPNSTIITLYPGCAHNLDTCINKFSNEKNYGGFPWIPTKNPMGGHSLI